MRGSFGLIGLMVGLVSVPGRAADPVPSLDQLVRMTRCELEALYRAAPVGAEPCGFLPGVAIFDPGTNKAVRKARFTHAVWKGKEFPGDGTMVNHTVAGVRAVTARVFVGESWFDGEPTLVLDYCGTSKVFGHVRDEMREIAPGVWVGLTYLRKPDGPPELSNYFALDGRCGPRR